MTRNQRHFDHARIVMMSSGEAVDPIFLFGIAH